ncbi:DUF7007 domain-containing protein [Methylocella sp.]|uniref:DUF7007 domain-containing protein n=1 Tax=Methylocella sp. TaxID=1978226 RepID=UPI0037851183
MPPLTLDSADLIAPAPFSLAPFFAARAAPRPRVFGFLRTRQGARPPALSPWGALVDWAEVAPGLCWFKTQERGGYHLAPRRQRAVPRALRSADGWYEDRVEWAAVAVVFARIFDAIPAGAAGGRSLYELGRETLRAWRPEDYESWFETTLDMDEIWDLPVMRFHRERRDQWIALDAPCAALGRAADGRALVRAKLGGDPPYGASLDSGGGPLRLFAAPLDELHRGRGRPFVIDPARHAAATADETPEEPLFRAPGWNLAARPGQD